MGLENLLKYIEAIMMMLPLIEKIVTLIEGLFAKLGGGQGTAKKEAVLEMSKGVLANAGVGLPDEILSSMVDSVVKIKNTIGEFTHGAPELLNTY